MFIFMQKYRKLLTRLLLLHKQSHLNRENWKSLQNIPFPNISTKRASKKCAQSEDDDCIEFIDGEDIIIEKLTSDDIDDRILNEHTKNAFDKEKSDSLN